MRLRNGVRISDMPNIIGFDDPADTRYFGYKGNYEAAICPVCHEEFYYNKKLYTDGFIPATCGRYSCLRGWCLNGL